MSSSQPSEAKFEELELKLQEEGIVKCASEGCPETFRSIWGLRFHLKKNACNIVKFRCGKCKRDFDTSIILQRHTTTCNKQENTEADLPSNEACSITSSVTDIAGQQHEATNTTPIKTVDDVQKIGLTQNELSGHEKTTKTQKTDNANIKNNGNSDSDTQRSKHSGNLTSSTEQKTPQHKGIEDLNEQQSDPPKRKRGRPKKSATSNQQQPITPKVQPPEKKSKFKTPDSASHSSLRKSSRSRGKKVNYSQIDQGDPDDDDDDEDDDDINASKSSETPKRKGRPRKKLDSGTDDHDKISTTASPSTMIATSSTLSSETRKKRVGRPKKSPAVGDDGDEIAIATPDKSETPKRRGGRQKKSPAVGDDDGDEIAIATPDKSETPKRRGGRPKKTNAMGTNDSEQDDGKLDGDDKDDDNSTKPAPKKKGRPKKLTDEQSLRRKAKSGQILPCGNKCGKKFTTYIGYQAHMKLCGKAERETFTCEACGKVYQSEPGLKYHMKAVHEKQTVAETEKEEDKSTADDDDETDGTRRVRRAAARAIEKVKSLNEDKTVAGKTTTAATPSRRGALDVYIEKKRDNLVTFSMVKQWKKEIKDNGKIVCPNETCHEEFLTPHVLQSHFLHCGYDSAAYSCKKCAKEFLTIAGARYHVESVHYKSEDKESEGEDHCFDVDYSNSESDEDDDDSGDDVDDVSISSLKKGKFTHIQHGKGKEKRHSITVGEMNETYKMHSKWRRRHVPREDLFQEHLPRMPFWQRVQVESISEYIPTSASSPHFVISRPDNTTSDDKQLPLFTGLDKTESGNYGDCTFNTGGPVWGLAWCPTPDSEKTADQFVAVSVHRSYQSVYHSYKHCAEKGTIQLWNIGPLTNSSSRSGSTPVLSLCIAHDFGPVFQLMWCPYGAWQPDDTTDGDCLPRLGLLAAACGDGIVRILSIPHPEILLSKLPLYCNNTNSIQDKEFFKAMVHVTCQLELFPCPLNVSYHGNRGIAVCIDWSQIEPFCCVAAGFSDGSVAVWNLSSPSPILTKKKQGNQTRLAPFVLLNAHTSMVRAVALCPVSQDFIVTGGEERCYKIWDIKSPSFPMAVIRKNYPQEVVWPLHCNGFFYCEHDVYNKDPPSLRYCNISLGNFKVLVVHASGIWSLSYNQWLGIAASADVSGDVYISKAVAKHSPSRTASWPLYKSHLESLTASQEGQENGVDDNNTKENQLKQTTPSLCDTINTSRLVYDDKNPLQFQFVAPSGRKDLQHNPTPYLLNSPTLPSVHKVRWNPNKQAMAWIASGGASGLVRLHHVKEVKTSQPVAQDTESPSSSSPL